MNGNLKDTCSKEIGLHPQNMINILHSIVNIIIIIIGGGLCNHLATMRIFDLTLNKVFIRAP